MTRAIVFAVCAALTANCAMGQRLLTSGTTTQTPSPHGNASAIRSAADAIAPGTRVRVRLIAGKDLNATLLAADADGVVVSARTRVPEPARRIAFDEIASIERTTGGALGKGMAIGAAIGAGITLAVLAAIAASLD